MLDMVERAREGEDGGNVLLFERDAETFEDKAGEVYVRHDEPLACAVCGFDGRADRLRCRDGFCHPATGTRVCSDCGLVWDWENIRMTEAELDEFCSAADAGDIKRADEVVRGAHGRAGLASVLVQ